MPIKPHLAETLQRIPDVMMQARSYRNMPLRAWPCTLWWSLMRNEGGRSYGRIALAYLHPVTKAVKDDPENAVLQCAIPADILGCSGGADHQREQVVDVDIAAYRTGVLGPR